MNDANDPSRWSPDRLPEIEDLPPPTRTPGIDEGLEILAGVHEQVEALQGDDLEIGDLEDLDEVVAADEGPLAVARSLRRRQWRGPRSRRACRKA